jgi:phi LC3 family holin
MINWKVRFKNRAWLTAFIAQGFLFIELFLAALNGLGIIDFQLTEQLKQDVLNIVNVVLVMLAMLGVVQDPTTKGFNDSERAKGYQEPN